MTAGLVKPAIAEAVVAAFFAFIMIQTHPYWTEAAAVVPFMFMPAVWFAGLVVNGVTCALIREGRARLFWWSFAIGVQPCLIFFLVVMIHPYYGRH